ncbi:MAG: NAD-binding protein, partial [Williamsia herbipolensis]|nr:NAD-binding protein [Williamsia herbipolensis]
MRQPGVIVCGHAGVAVPITDHLLAAGAHVAVVVRDAVAAGQVAATRHGVDVVVCAGPIGDALVEAGLETADAVVCVEDGEMANLETALVARRLRPDVRIVT